MFSWTETPSQSCSRHLSHTKLSSTQAAGAKLKTLAASYSAAPGTQLNAQQQQLLKTLQGQSGKNFDLVYLTQQVSAHNEAINLFTSYSQPTSSADADVRQFAAQTLPSLKSHLQDILSAQKAASGTASGSAGKASSGTTTKPVSTNKPATPAQPASGSK